MFACGFIGVGYATVLLVTYSARLVRRPIENARAQLSAKGFAATHGMMSIKRDVMIAVDERRRIALCELGRRGVVLTTRIVECGDLIARAIEDGRDLDEDTQEVPSKGALLLRVTHEGRDHEIVFTYAVPRRDEASLDYAEYADIRGMVRWWRATIAGETPDRPYPLASRIAVYSSGSVVDAIARERLRRHDKPELPRAVARDKEEPKT